MAGPARRRDFRARKLLWLATAVLAPFALFIAHGASFSGWQIDDAGISYAYARNLAAGEGLVAQPGDEPVEGFTNLLWVLLLAPLIPLVDSPGLAARGLSYGFVLASFMVLALGARAWFARHGWLAAGVGLSTTALVTGFVAWTLSGLENGLYAFLVAAFVVATTLASDATRSGAAVGGIWILLIATRPEAAPLVLVPAIVWASWRNRRALTAFALSAASGLLALTAFRVLYFGDAFPNTYYAKSAPGWKELAGVSWTPVTGLGFGLAGAVVLVAVVGAAGALAAKLPRLRARSPRRLGLFALWLTLALSYLIFETLPSDWMGEGRFATALFLLGPMALLGLVRRWKAALAGASVALLVAAGAYSSRHTPAFAGSPPAPFGSVLELSDRLAAVGEALGTARSTSVLLPDIGGALWRGRFVVVDVAGLIDRRIARTLKAEERGPFHDYVFEHRRPDLIWSHGYWRRTAGLESDPRLGRDYELLFDDGFATLHVRATTAGDIGRDRLRAAFQNAG